MKHDHILKMFILYNPNVTTGGYIFGPRAMFWTNLIQVYQVMLHTKYQGGSVPSGFRKEDFSRFPYMSHFTKMKEF